MIIRYLRSLDPSFRLFLVVMFLAAIMFWIAAIAGCSVATKAGASSAYAMTCEVTGETRRGYVDRCENAEAICYESDRGISCIKKGTP